MKRQLAFVLAIIQALVLFVGVLPMQAQAAVTIDIDSAVTADANPEKLQKNIINNADGASASSAVAALGKETPKPMGVDNLLNKVERPTTRADRPITEGDRLASKVEKAIKAAESALNTVAPATSGDVVTSGTCGPELTWTLYANGEMVISGTGTMYSYTTEDAPWTDYAHMITSITVEKGVTTISELAFCALVSLKTVSIPSSVTLIGDLAFYGCVSLEAIWVDSANANYSSDNYGVLHSKHKTLLIHAPAAMSGEYRISMTVINIYQYAFCYSSLTNVIMPTDLNMIGDYAFRNCEKLTDVMIPLSLAYIGIEAFYGCTSLTTIDIPSSVVYLGYSSFGKCPNLEKINILGNNIYYVSDSAGVLYNKETGFLQQVPGAFTGAYTIPDGVTGIETGAFEDCDGLTAVTIPPSVTGIGYYAFDSCDNLTDVYISDANAWCKINYLGYGTEESVYATPMAYAQHLHILDNTGEEVTDLVLDSTVTQIPWDAFSGCESLKSVAIPESVSMIDDYAFSGCTSLASVTMPQRVTYLGTGAFYRCTSLKSVTIPEGIRSLQSRAFSGCTSLESAIIPEGVKYISLEAFNGCTSLESVIIPESVQYISDEAFYGCTSLASVTIPDGVIQIGYGAFMNCSSLRSVTIPGGVAEIREYTFAGCSTLTDLTIGNGVSSIGYAAFWACTSLGDVTLPGSLTSIDAYAFFDCGTIGSLHVPASLTSIKTYAFDGCSIKDLYIADPIAWCELYFESYSHPCYYSEAVHLLDSNGNEITSLVLNNTIQVIEPYTFSNCINLESIAIPDSVTAIEFAAFLNCAGLQAVTIPAGVTVIEDLAFSGCSSLNGFTVDAGNASYSSDETGVLFDKEKTLLVMLPGAYAGDYAIPTSVTAIGNYAFSFCHGLTAVTIPDGVISIGLEAFNGCIGLQSLVIPDSVVTMGEYAFCSCTDMKDVTIGNGITVIPYCAFLECTALESIHFPERITTIEEFAFQGCTGLETVIIPDNITTLGAYAFSLCSGLKNVTIGKGISVIGECAFWECTSLETIVIPENITSVDIAAFADCTALKEIYFMGDEPTIDALTFRNVTATAYYPADNATWMDALTQSYGGNITWVPMEVDNSGVGYVEEDGGVKIVGCDGGEGELEIPEEIDGMPVTTIADNAFAGAKGITSVVIPESVTDIGEFAFYNCPDLSSVTIHGKRGGEGAQAVGRNGTVVTNIGEYAFAGCTVLKRIFFEGDAPVISESAFVDVTATAYYPADNATWTQDIRQNYGGNITWVADELPKPSVSVSLTEKVVLNFYVPEDLVNEENQIVVKYKGEGLDASGYEVVHDAKYKEYRISIPLNANNMCEELSLQILDANGNPLTQERIESIRSYVRLRLDNAKAPVKEKRVFIAALDYGALAQLAMDANETDLANSIVTAADRTILDNFTWPTATNDPDAAVGSTNDSKFAVTASLKDAVVLNFYIYKTDLGANKIQIKRNGNLLTVSEDYTVTEDSKEYCVSIPMNANHMCDIFSAQVVDAEGNAVHAARSLSMRHYVGMRLVNPKATAAEKRVFIAALDYGALAQLAMNESATDLANRYITDADREALKP